MACVYLIGSILLSFSGTNLNLIKIYPNYKQYSNHLMIRQSVHFIPSETAFSEVSLTTKAYWKYIFILLFLVLSHTQQCSCNTPGFVLRSVSWWYWWDYIECQELNSAWLYGRQCPTFCAVALALYFVFLSGRILLEIIL